MSTFTIDKVGWHTAVKGNTESLDKIHERFRNVVGYFRQRGLLRSSLLENDAPITDDFAIRSDDLTEEGLQLVKRTYDTWLKAVDRGKSVSDLSMFERELSKIRATKEDRKG